MHRVLHRSKGVNLVELLIVLAIMSVTTTLLLSIGRAGGIGARVHQGPPGAARRRHPSLQPQQSVPAFHGHLHRAGHELLVPEASGHPEDRRPLRRLGQRLPPRPRFRLRLFARPRQHRRRRRRRRRGRVLPAALGLGHRPPSRAEAHHPGAHPRDLRAMAPRRGHGHLDGHHGHRSRPPAPGLHRPRFLGFRAHGHRPRHPRRPAQGRHPLGDRRGGGRALQQVEGRLGSSASMRVRPTSTPRIPWIRRRPSSSRAATP